MCVTHQLSHCRFLVWCPQNECWYGNPTSYWSFTIQPWVNNKWTLSSPKSFCWDLMGVYSLSALLRRYVMGVPILWQMQAAGKRKVSKYSRPDPFSASNLRELNSETLETSSYNNCCIGQMQIISDHLCSRVRQKCPKCMESTIPSWILFQWPHTMSEHFLESMADH